MKKILYLNLFLFILLVFLFVCQPVMAGDLSDAWERARVAEIIIDALQGIGLRYPEPSAEDRSEFAEARAELCKND